MGLFFGGRDETPEPDLTEQLDDFVRKIEALNVKVKAMLWELRADRAKHDHFVTCRECVSPAGCLTFRILKSTADTAHAAYRGLP